MKRLAFLLLPLLLAACAKPVKMSPELEVLLHTDVPIRPEKPALENQVLLRNAGLPEDFELATQQLDDPLLARMLCFVAMYHHNWNNAWLAFNSWVRLAAWNPERLKLNIRLLGMLGDIDKAAQALETKLSVEDLENPEIWMSVGQMLLFRMDPERGVQVWRAMKKKPMPKTEASLRRYRDLMLAFRSMPDALEASKKLAELTGKDKDLEMAAALARDLKQSKTQIRLLRHMLSRRPDSKETAYTLAATLYEDGQVDEAIKVLKSRKQDPLAWYTAITFLREQNRNEEAEKLYQALKALPDELEGKAYYAGRAAEILQHEQEAMRWYEQAGEPYRSRAQMQIAVLLADEGRGDEAMQRLHKLRGAADVDAIRLARLGAQLAIQLHRPRQAMDWFDSVEPEGEQGKLLRYDQAMFLLQQEQVDEALKLFKQLADEYPEDLQMVNAYAYTLVDQTDRLQEAEPLLKKVVEAEPNNAAFLDSLGWLQYRQGKLQEAEQTLRKAWKLDQDPEIAAHLGEVLWKLDRRQEALKIWSQARKAHPDNAALIRTVKRFVQ